MHLLIMEIIRLIIKPYSINMTLIELKCVKCGRIKAFCTTSSFVTPKRFMCTTLAQLHVITVGSS